MYEELVHVEAFAGDCIHQFRHGLRIKKRAILPTLKRIAAIEQLVFREVDHHLPLAGLAVNWIDFETVGSRSQNLLVMNEMELWFTG